MSIPRDRLEARLVEVRHQADLLKQQFIMAAGAVAELEHWLNAPSNEEGGNPPVEKD